MQPRLKNSNKYTAFPSELNEQIVNVFKEGFTDLNSKGRFFIEGRIYTEEILFRIGYLEQGRLQQNNFEASIQFSTQKDNPVDIIHTCIDATASMLQEFIETEGSTDFPYQWKEVQFGGKSMYLQYSTVNTELEAQADLLLGDFNADLVKESATEQEETDLVKESASEQEETDLVKEFASGDEQSDLNDEALIDTNTSAQEMDKETFDYVQSVLGQNKSTH